MEKRSETDSGLYIEVVVKNSGGEAWVVTSILINSC